MQKLLIASYIIILLYAPVLISFWPSSLSEEDFPIDLSLEYRQEFDSLGDQPGNITTIRYEMNYWLGEREEVQVDIYRSQNGYTTLSKETISYPNADSYIHVVAPLWLNATNIQEESTMMFGGIQYQAYASRVYLPEEEFESMAFFSSDTYGNITVLDELHYHASYGVFLAGYKMQDDWNNESNVFWLQTELEFSNINSFGALARFVDATLISMIFVECIVLFCLIRRKRD
ncbi:MAG: hypothetical protein ACXADC_14380 [Candidatus Thorarchaeota archaeon]|jgi:hypothetical protein